MQAHPFRNYISAVISPPNYTSLPSTVATFLATCLMAVQQPSKYSIFYSRDTSIQLSLFSFLLFLSINSYICHIQVHLSGKLHPCGDATSELYKPTFHGGHLSRNTSHGGAATLWVFRLPRRRYSYSTQFSMTELILSVSQH